ncbi:DsbA family oxidoreductase [Sphingobacterium shayense]|uniref:DsbA family oxidoreductase n=1 Tax=Sphingobacterium shayense TaxID=626343 RepID=UPI0015571B19|nr:DsbA family oxidoreductase [Sphingobacterium shayense]NQD72478.1 DsbA family oxidoreductase [Sphingobacterium shayense]
MIVEIWSDVMCPFCYIGKRRFEKALAGLSFGKDIQVEWKSYLLDKHLRTDPDVSYFEHLANSKGMSVEQARDMCQQVTDMAKEEGLNYDFDNAVVANSVSAHRLSHFAKKQGKQNDIEELLFEAYFCHGKNIDDYSELITIAEEVGLDKDNSNDVLVSGQFDEDVNKDLYEAQQVGVRGVPFFVFDRKYAISGAQPIESFDQALSKSYGEWKKEQPKL